jgi:hypothetical protein
MAPVEEEKIVDGNCTFENRRREGYFFISIKEAAAFIVCNKLRNKACITFE